MLQCCLCTAIGAAHICRVYLGAASTTPPPPPPRCSLLTSLLLLSSAAPAAFPIVAQPALPLSAHPFDQYLVLGELLDGDSEARCCLRSKFGFADVLLESLGGLVSRSQVKYRDSCSPSINKVSTKYFHKVMKDIDPPTPHHLNQSSDNRILQISVFDGRLSPKRIKTLLVVQFVQKRCQDDFLIVDLCNI